MNCDYHHELDGWLPLLPDESAADNERDAILVTHDMAIDADDRELEGQVYTLIVNSSQYVACPCNPLWSDNETWFVDIRRRAAEMPHV